MPSIRPSVFAAATTALLLALPALGQPAPKGASGSTPPELVGKWGTEGDGCETYFIEYLPEGRVRAGLWLTTGNWRLDPWYPAGTYTRQGDRVSVTFERVDGQGRIVMEQILERDADGDVMLRDVAHREVKPGEPDLSLALTQSYHCPPDLVETADADLEGRLEPLLTQAREQVAFTQANPFAAQIRADLVAFVAAYPDVLVGGLPGDELNPLVDLPLERTDTGYRLTVPGLVFLGEGELVIPPFSIDFQEAPQGRIGVSGRFTAPVVFYELISDVYEPVAELRFEDAAFTGIWRRDVRGFTTLDGGLTRPSLIDLESGQPFLRMERLAVGVESREIDARRLSGVARLVATDVRGPDGQARQLMASLTAEALDVPAWLAVDWLALEEVPMLLDRAPRSGRDRAEAGALLDSVPRPFTTLRLDLSATGLAPGVNVPPGILNGDWNASVAVAGLDQPGAEMRLSLRHNHDASVPPPPPAVGLVPDTLNLDLRLTSLPLAPAWTIMLDALLRGAVNGRMAAAVAGLRVVHRILSDRPTLALGLDAQARDAGIKADGEMRLDPASPLLLVGTMEATARGLAGLAQRRAEEGVPAAGAALLMQFGEKTENPEMLRYRLALTPDGRLLLNDRDLLPVLNLVP